MIVHVKMEQVVQIMVIQIVLVGTVMLHEEIYVHVMLRMFLLELRMENMEPIKCLMFKDLQLSQLHEILSLFLG
jgi:hypothetical protein